MEEFGSKLVDVVRLIVLAVQLVVLGERLIISFVLMAALAEH